MHTIVQQDSYSQPCMIGLSLGHLFVLLHNYVKGGQVTSQSCMVVNSYPVELLCACLLSKRITINNYTVLKTSWPYLISELLVADLFTMLLLLGLAIFLHPRCFCLALYFIILFKLLVTQI